MEVITVPLLHECQSRDFLVLLHSGRVFALLGPQLWMGGNDQAGVHWKPSTLPNPLSTMCESTKLTCVFKIGTISKVTIWGKSQLSMELGRVLGQRDIRVVLGAEV